jgi:hypothetical protein
VDGVKISAVAEVDNRLSCWLHIDMLHLILWEAGEFSPQLDYQNASALYPTVLFRR